jgi:acyl-CoA thioester hydrolase
MIDTPPDTPPGGHDGPYAAPITVTGRRVLPEWIDYNGHMNVGFYGIAFDKALDVVLDRELGTGEDFVRSNAQGPYVLQSHLHFLSEMREGAGFSVRFRLLDHDARRLHLFAQMVADDSGAVCATQELMVMNVDHHSGRSAPYPDWAQRRFAQMQADHAGLAPAPQIGAGLGIRR